MIGSHDTLNGIGTFMLRSLQWTMSMAIIGGIITFAILNRRQFRKRWRRGLKLSLALFAMLIPPIIFSVAYFDTSALEQHMQIAVGVGFIIGLVIHVLKIAWNMIMYVAACAEWQKYGTGPLGGARHRPLSLSELTEPVLFGAVAAVISTVLFQYLHVGQGSVVEMLKGLFPHAADAPQYISIPVVLLSVCAVAITEELVYRGAIMAFFFRVTRNHPVLTRLSIVMITLPWALAHIPNTDAPVVKVTQMLIIGLFLANLAQRKGLRAAIAAHLSLNIVSTLAAYIWYEGV